MSKGKVCGIILGMKSAFQCVTKKEIMFKGAKDILILGDVGCTGFYEDSKKVFGEILKKKTDLFVIIGDLAHTGKKEEFEELINFANERTKAPIFSLCGNHDLPDYKECCGLSSYALILERLVLILLDNADAHFRKEDFEFLRDEFERHYKDKKFIVLCHVPPPVDFVSSYMSAEEWRGLKQILDRYRDRIECLVCAHIHGFYEYYIDGYHVFVTAGGGGSMIYELPKAEYKRYNALKISLREGALSSIKFIPVDTEGV